jgi:proline iminopeptidase
MFFNLFKREPRAFNSGWLPEKDGHEIFFQEFGNPAGKAVLAFHGGPGGSSKPRHAGIYNLKKCRVVLFDQRGCGRSRFTDKLYRNTTAEALSDAIRLLDFLNIKSRIVAAGGSWGSTLALLFSEKHPARVEKIFVNSVFLARRRDVREWCQGEARRFYPDLIEELERRTKGAGSIDEHYAKLLYSGDARKVREAVKYYGCLEDIMGAVDPKFKLPKPADFAKIRDELEVFMHYMLHDSFIAENQVLKNANRIRGIPMLIVHNRLDMLCPADQAWELHKACPKSRLHFVPDRGHGSDMMYKEAKRLLKEFT